MISCPFCKSETLIRVQESAYIEIYYGEDEEYKFEDWADSYICEKCGKFFWIEQY